MNPDEEAEIALREAYCDMVSRRLRAFAEAIDFPQEGAMVDQKALVQLFVRLDCPPAYSTWRASLLGGVAAAVESAPTGNGQEGRAASPGAAALKAAQVIKSGVRLTREEWMRAVKWAAAHGGRRLKGDDGRWNLTEQELAEALG